MRSIHYWKNVDVEEHFSFYFLEVLLEFLQACFSVDPEFALEIDELLGLEEVLRPEKLNHRVAKETAEILLAWVLPEDKSIYLSEGILFEPRLIISL